MMKFAVYREGPEPAENVPRVNRSVVRRIQGDDCHLIDRIDAHRALPSLITV
jgi:hypothetical protein